MPIMAMTVRKCDCGREKLRRCAPGRPEFCRFQKNPRGSGRSAGGRHPERHALQRASDLIAAPTLLGEGPNPTEGHGWATGKGPSPGKSEGEP